MATSLNLGCHDQNSKAWADSTKGVRWAHKSSCSGASPSSCREIPIRTGCPCPCSKWECVRNHGDGTRTCKHPGGTRTPPRERAGKPSARPGQAARQWSKWPEIEWRCASVCWEAQNIIITDSEGGKRCRRLDGNSKFEARGRRRRVGEVQMMRP